VDSQCDIENVYVYEDYSCKLVLKDLEYSAALPQDKYLKMQLLERKDRKKWFVWFATSRQGKETIKPRSFTFYNSADAISEFENKFKKETGNSWSQRDYFQPKLSKYTLVSAEREI
jgi:hypothetical protein